MGVPFPPRPQLRPQPLTQAQPSIAKLRAAYRVPALAMPALNGVVILWGLYSLICKMGLTILTFRVVVRYRMIWVRV